MVAVGATGLGLTEQRGECGKEAQLHHIQPQFGVKGQVEEKPQGNVHQDLYGHDTVIL